MIDEKVKEQILVIRDEGLTNMFDAKTVQVLAFEREFYELVNLIEEDKKAYTSFILRGE